MKTYKIYLSCSGLDVFFWEYKSLYLYVSPINMAFFEEVIDWKYAWGRNLIKRIQIKVLLSALVIKTSVPWSAKLPHWS